MSQPASVGSLPIASVAGTDPKARPLSMDAPPLELILYILPPFPLKSLIATRGVNARSRYLAHTAPLFGPSQTTRIGIRPCGRAARDTNGSYAVRAALGKWPQHKAGVYTMGLPKVAGGPLSRWV